MLCTRHNLWTCIINYLHSVLDSDKELHIISFYEWKSSFVVNILNQTQAIPTPIFFICLQYSFKVYFGPHISRSYQGRLMSSQSWMFECYLLMYFIIWLEKKANIAGWADLFFWYFVMGVLEVLFLPLLVGIYKILVFK